MKNITLFLKTLLLVGFFLSPVFSYAVTKDEMEQARTIAAKAYLRYANDGSGYLDDLNPKTIEQLESALKTKEKENIKAFKAIPVPNDYKDWGKEKLVEYWAVTAFQNKGLQEKGRGGRLRARSQINKMTIAAPAPVPTAAATPTSTSEASKDNSGKMVTPPAENADSTLSLLNDEEKTLADMQQIEEGNEKVDKATNYTWVYIMVLAILVVIVIILVVYAANVFKKDDSDVRSHEWEKPSEDLEHLESKLADKDVEIAMLNKKLENANRQNSELKAKIETLTAELSALKNNVTEKVVPSSLQKSEAKTTDQVSLRSIYLGRANAKGIFVRADRTLNIGNSVFVLETSDGYSGTFRVANSQAAWSLALSNPAEYLENACTGHNLEDTAQASRIITDMAGTAVFEGGCWRVIRKARIRYQ